MLALLGEKKVISNVNFPNLGQMSQLPIGSIVETNCVFSENSIKPIVSKPLPEKVINLVMPNCQNIDDTYYAIKERSLEKIFYSFKKQPLLMHLNEKDCLDLFKEMVLNTREYLDEYFDIDKFVKEFNYA